MNKYIAGMIVGMVLIAVVVFSRNDQTMTEIQIANTPTTVPISTAVHTIPCSGELTPSQTEGLLPKVMAGDGFTVTVTAAVLEQPLLLPVTV